MKLLLKIVICAFLTSFAARAIETHGEPFLARITYYTDHQTASGKKPVQGVTVAAEKAHRFGSKFYIPQLKVKVGGNGEFVVHDRGPWVQSRKASKGKLPVIDIYVSSHSKVRALGRQKDNVFKVYRIK